MNAPNQPDWLVEIRAGDAYQRGHRAAADLMAGYTPPPPVTDPTRPCGPTVVDAMTITEAEFQQQVIDLAHLYGWHVNHTRRSIGKHGRWVTATSCRGFPDLTTWNPRQLRFLFAELKTEKGRVTPDQHDVLASMAETGIEVYVWRPSDFDVIQAVLKGPRPTGRGAARPWAP